MPIRSRLAVHGKPGPSEKGPRVRMLFRRGDRRVAVPFRQSVRRHPEFSRQAVRAELIPAGLFNEDVASPGDDSIRFDHEPVPGKLGRHSGAPDAARVALEAGVGRLALLHCVEERQAAALAAAQALFPNTFWPEDGETVTL